ncbi:TylF/MycF/NovP-related O-methyltransferase [uncultured Helicobacter sp.]|uniref:TylF/MycF/NovP-related O-methyltransferase n=1 Tax=uncultured Helicobacter sp. TaxID=175537 RepID=UPI00374F7CAF
MQDIIIFGSEGNGMALAQELLEQNAQEMASSGGGVNILFFIDNNPTKYDERVNLSINEKKYEFAIKPPQEVLNTQFDKIHIATMSGCESCLRQLSSYGVDMLKVDSSYVKVKLEARINFLKSFARECKDKGIEGDVAEVGVFQGDFAQKINHYFPHKKLYLFDTFEGFDTRDLQNESDETKKMGRYLNDTSINLVMSKMPNPSKVIIKKGYFPETAAGLENERFCFVNLDTDLYEPIKAGLEFFYPKMQRGGVILIHDYFNSAYPGVKRAVDEFCTKHNIFAIPGDDISIAVCKA